MLKNSLDKPRDQYTQSWWGLDDVPLRLAVLGVVPSVSLSPPPPHCGLDTAAGAGTAETRHTSEKTGPGSSRTSSHSDVSSLLGHLVVTLSADPGHL